MVLQWEERDELGNVITQTNPTISLENAASYAKKTCRTCWSKGYNFYDSGSYWVFGESGELEPKPINPRTILCDCAIRTINRTGV